VSAGLDFLTFVKRGKDTLIPAYKTSWRRASTSEAGRGSAAESVPQHLREGRTAIMTSRLSFIDTLRAIACLAVLQDHAYVFWAQEPHFGHLCVAGVVSVASSFGYLGVPLFLALSGFCLYYPIVRRQPPRLATVDLPTFFRRRAQRILPPYYVALALFAALAALPALRPMLGTVSVKNVLMHLLMLHNLSSQTVGSINGSFWTLALEFQLYLVFPLFVWLGRRGGLRLLLGATFLLSLAYQTVVWLQVRAGMAPTLSGLLYEWMPGRCFEFVAGMAAAACVARPKSQHGLLRSQIWGVVFASLILLASRIPAHAFDRSRILAALTWLGVASYSVYLLHMPLLQMSAPLLRPLHLAPLPTFGLFALVGCPAVIGIGYVFFLCFERPILLHRERKVPSTLAVAQGGN
jgi:peptidoglycan/LPS O-acetylase OafA/YrhL